MRDVLPTYLFLKVEEVQEEGSERRTGRGQRGGGGLRERVGQK